jgi:hypothetical protein
MKLEYTLDGIINIGYSKVSYVQVRYGVKEFW